MVAPKDVTTPRRRRGRHPRAGVTFVSIVLMTVGFVPHGTSPLRADDGAAPSPRIVVEAADPAFGERVRREAERVLAGLGARLAPGLLEGETPLVTIVMEDDRAAYLARADRAGASTAGAFAEDGRLVCWRGATDEDVLRMVRHEVTHHLVAWATSGAAFEGYQRAPVSRAIDEGLAEAWEAGGPDRPNLEHPPMLRRVLDRSGRPSLFSLADGARLSSLAPLEERAFWWAFAVFLLEDDGRTRWLAAKLTAPDAITPIDVACPGASRAWERRVAQLADWQSELRRSFDDAAPRPGTGEDVASLVAALGADDFEARERASAGLEQLGPAALPAVLGALNDRDPEIAARARSIAFRSLGAGRGNWWSAAAPPAGQLEMFPGDATPRRSSLRVVPPEELGISGR